MTIINTDQGHVIQTSNKKRPFRICKNGRMVSFKTLEAAKQAMSKSTEAAHSEVVAMRESGVSC